MTDLRLKYQTIEFLNTDIHLCTLRDNQQYYDPDGKAEGLGICSASWPIFGVIWPSSMALAHFMDSYNIKAKRILEVGCGIALPSLLLNSKNADITATDYHPEVESFLKRNVKINEDQKIFFERTSWADKDDSLGLFDLIIGSDLLYEDEHITLLANFIDAHASATCEVIIVDPGRGRKTKLDKAMVKLGYICHYQDIPADIKALANFSGYILKFVKTKLRTSFG
ncbi:methyltransferase [Aliikangiella sp. G2MR2-5]|uniref:class I SAM-dependent methyltransferase n=1 Tax=Aliikangiella sp. G2MR2-5 TaxID=2788943 RepID=UPI0018AB1634|nr:histidine kinase [Aliikangiella sp. G2MR2-5]